MAGLLKGKVALVTGAAAGIGRVSAIAFAREEAKVVVADIDAAGGKETVKMIEKAGGTAIFIKADVANASEVEAMISKAVKTYGQLNCAHNNSGILGVTAPTTEWTENDWDRVFDVNVKGVWLCMKYEIPQMAKVGGGTIVNTASAWGLVGALDHSAYVASKHAVAGLTRASALEYAKTNIRVNAVCPVAIRTPTLERKIAGDLQREAAMAEGIPIGRLGKPLEVAEAVVWLCSDASSFVTGLVMPVDGGYTAQ